MNKLWTIYVHALHDTYTTNTLCLLRPEDTSPKGSRTPAPAPLHPLVCSLSSVVRSVARLGPLSRSVAGKVGPTSLRRASSTGTTGLRVI